MRIFLFIFLNSGSKQNTKEVILVPIPPTETCPCLIMEEQGGQASIYHPLQLLQTAMGGAQGSQFVYTISQLRPSDRT